MEYVLLYVDDVLVVSEKAESIIRNEIGQHWRIKESSIEKPSLYLGGRCRKVELTDGTKCWAFGSSQYAQAAVKNFAYLQTGLDFLRHDRGGYEGGATSIHARFKR